MLSFLYWISPRVVIPKLKEYKTIKKMQKLIEEKDKVKIPEESIRRKLHKVGYSWKSSRPSPYKGDREKQKEFKKNLKKCEYKKE